MNAALGVITISDNIERGDEGYSSDSFRAALESCMNQGAEEIVINVNSGGGDVIEALAIFDGIKALDLPTTSRIYGLAASAATIICLACDKVVMNQSALMMLHEPRVCTTGTLAEMESNLVIFSKMRDRIIGIYADKTGIPPEEIVSLIASDYWLTAAEALEKGFVDEVPGIKAPETETDIPEEQREQETTETETEETPEPLEESEDDDTEDDMPSMTSALSGMKHAKMKGLSVLGTIPDEDSRSLHATIDGLKIQLSEALEAAAKFNRTAKEERSMMSEMVALSAAAVSPDELPTPANFTTTAKVDPMKIKKELGLNALIRAAANGQF